MGQRVDQGVLRRFGHMIGWKRRNLQEKSMNRIQKVTGRGRPGRGWTDSVKGVCHVRPCPH